MGIRSPEINPFAGPSREIAVVRTKKLFLGLNYTVVSLSVAGILNLMLISLSPTGWGWLLLLIETLTLSAGVAGIMSRKLPSCYTLLVVMTTIAGVLQGISALALFTRSDKCLSNLNPMRVNDYDGKALLKIYASLALVLFCLLWVLLGLACVVHHCFFSDFYQDLEASNKKPSRSAKVQGEPYNEFSSVQL